MRPPARRRDRPRPPTRTSTRPSVPRRPIPLPRNPSPPPPPRLAFLSGWTIPARLAADVLRDDDARRVQPSAPSDASEPSQRDAFDPRALTADFREWVAELRRFQNATSEDIVDSEALGAEQVDSSRGTSRARADAAVDVLLARRDALRREADAELATASCGSGARSAHAAGTSHTMRKLQLFDADALSTLADVLVAQTRKFFDPLREVSAGVLAKYVKAKFAKPGCAEDRGVDWARVGASLGARGVHAGGVRLEGVRGISPIFLRAFATQRTRRRRRRRHPRETSTRATCAHVETRLLVRRRAGEPPRGVGTRDASLIGSRRTRRRSRRRRPRAPRAAVWRRPRAVASERSSELSARTDRRACSTRCSTRRRSHGAWSRCSTSPRSSRAGGVAPAVTERRRQDGEGEDSIGIAAPDGESEDSIGIAASLADVAISAATPRGDETRERRVRLGRGTRGGRRRVCVSV